MLEYQAYVEMSMLQWRQLSEILSEDGNRLRIAIGEKGRHICLASLSAPKACLGLPATGDAVRVETLVDHLITIDGCKHNHKI